MPASERTGRRPGGQAWVWRGSGKSERHAVGGTGGRGRGARGVASWHRGHREQEWLADLCAAPNMPQIRTPRPPRRAPLACLSCVPRQARRVAPQSGGKDASAQVFSADVPTVRARPDR